MITIQMCKSYAAQAQLVWGSSSSHCDCPERDMYAGWRAAGSQKQFSKLEYLRAGGILMAASEGSAEEIWRFCRYMNGGGRAEEWMAPIGEAHYSNSRKETRQREKDRRHFFSIAPKNFTYNKSLLQMKAGFVAHIQSYRRWFLNMKSQRHPTTDNRRRRKSVCVGISIDIYTDTHAYTELRL